MTYQIDIQNVCDDQIPFSESELTSLASLALRDYQASGELTLRFVTPEDIMDLNNRYRKQNKTTNVLSFPSAVPGMVELEYPFLGDIIICPQVLAEESFQQKKSLKAHWSLIVIHGVLHLLGYDHINDDDAEVMQAIEVRLLAELGYNNPYELEDD